MMLGRGSLWPVQLIILDSSVVLANRGKAARPSQEKWGNVDGGSGMGGSHCADVAAASETTQRAALMDFMAGIRSGKHKRYIDQSAK